MRSKLNNNPDITIDDNNPANVQYANRYLEFFSIFTTIIYVLMKFKFARVYTLYQELEILIYSQLRWDNTCFSLS